MSQTFTGVRAIFKIQGKQVAFASDVNVTVNHAMQPIETLDRLDVVEHAEIGYTVDMSCGTFRVAGASAIQLGIQPILEEILIQPELMAELQDKIAGVTVARLVGVKMTSRGLSVNARGVATEQWAFVVRRFSDESTN